MWHNQNTTRTSTLECILCQPHGVHAVLSQHVEVSRTQVESPSERNAWPVSSWFQRTRHIREDTTVDIIVPVTIRFNRKSAPSIPLKPQNPRETWQYFFLSLAIWGCSTATDDGDTNDSWIWARCVKFILRILFPFFQWKECFWATFPKVRPLAWLE